MLKNSIATALNRGVLRYAAYIAASFMLLLSYFLILGGGPVKAAACAAPSTDYGAATSTVKVDNAATYRVWSRIMAPDTTNNSYLLEIDGTSCFVVGNSGSIAPNTWTWVDYRDGNTGTKVSINLSAGNHTIKMIGNEPSVKLGRVLFVSDANCVPVDNGDNCLIASDTTPPVVNITSPAENTTVSGVVPMNVDASDNAGVARVEFYVNGDLKATDTTAPYSYSWDSKTVANQQATLRAVAYDTANPGNSSADSLNVTVRNGDTQAPTVPTNAKAQANAANKVTVSWTASTDNVGVAGYWVTRDGAAIAKVTTGVQYVDATVLPGTVYGYRVMAFDAAGNNSPVSSVANVTTPAAPDTQAPTVPVGVVAKAVSQSQININWSASTDNVAVVGYDVYRSTNGGTAAKVGSAGGTSYGDTGLAAGVKYDYYIIARDVAGNVSSKSVIVSAKTQGKPPKVTRGTLSGKVTFNTKTADHAHVYIWANGSRKVYDTDSRGNYSIANLPAGTYRVKYQADGSSSKTMTIKITAGKVKQQDVRLQAR